MIKVLVNSQGKVYTSNNKALTVSSGGGNYQGLGTKYYKTSDLVPYFEIPSGAFEDYTVNYESSTGALGITGYDYLTGKSQSGIYYNGIINLGCTITDGVVTGFDRSSSSKYRGILLKDSFPSSMSQFKIIIKAKMASNQGGHAVLFATSDSPERYIGIRSSTNFALYDSGWTQGSTTITKDVWYWYCATFNGTTTTGYILEDNGYTLETLPELSQWSQQWSKTSNIWASNQFLFGVNPFSNGEVLSPSSQLDLSSTLIEVNNETFYSWELSSPTVTTAVGILKNTLSDVATQTDYNLYYDGNYVLNTSTQSDHFGGVVTVPAHTVETPFRPMFKINGFLNYEKTSNSKIFSNFANDRYIEANYKFNISSSTTMFVIVVHFKTQKIAYDSTQGSYKVLYFANFRDISQPKDYDYGMQLHIENDNRPWFVLGSSTGSRIFSFYGSALNYDTEYWIRVVGVNNGNPYMQVSTDGTNYTTVATYSSVVHFSDTTSTENLKYGVGTSSPFTGTIYSNGTFISIDGTTPFNMNATIIPQ